MIAVSGGSDDDDPQALAKRRHTRTTSKLAIFERARMAVHGKVSANGERTMRQCSLFVRTCTTTELLSRKI
jgi:hypothetical protein